MSELLRLYLGSVIEHLSNMAPSAGTTATATTTTTTATHVSLPGRKSCRVEGGVSGGKTQLEWLVKLSTKRTKAGPRKFDGGVSDVWKASLSPFPSL